MSDLDYVATWAGFVHVVFVIDTCARRIVGERASRTAHASFVLDALEQTLHDRRPAHRGGLIHHSDRGSQYVSIKYTERLAEAGIEPSVGSVGDSYDNALAETINGLFEAAIIGVLKKGRNPLILAVSALFLASAQLRSLSHFTAVFRQLSKRPGFSVTQGATHE